MDNIIEITDLLTKLSNSNLIIDITSLNDKYKILEEKYSELLNVNKTLEDKLKICNDQYSDLNKVSYVRSLSVELQSKNNLIKQLESQLEKYKTKNNDNNHNKEEMNTNDSKKDKYSKEEEFKTYEFNIDNYEEIDNYELIKYKNKYYLKDNNNNVYSILNNNPYLLVGTINNKGKVILV
jgi:hypothetical protein